jgi:hypothetical protein
MLCCIAIVLDEVRPDGIGTAFARQAPDRGHEYLPVPSRTLREYGFEAPLPRLGSSWFFAAPSPAFLPEPRSLGC